MHEADAQSVLRCGQCNKPFDKESTLKRHGYYCRSRRANSTTRSRSCIPCASAKARCDNGRPECSRCLSKAITCSYWANAPKHTRSRSQYIDNATTQQRSVVPSLVADHPDVEIVHEAGAAGGTLFNTAHDITYLDFADLADGSFDPDIDIADFVNPQIYDEGDQYHFLEPSYLAGDSTSSTDHTSQAQRTIYSPDLSIQAVPTYTIRSFNKRSRFKSSAQRTANLILHTLKSYPLMILRDITLPPFIHPHLISSNVENNDMEPLNNCISLTHMLNSRVYGSRKLFWKNVLMECEHLWADHLRLNKWELLAAMQALSIYILIRLDEGETDHNNLDSLMVTTVIALATRFNSMDITSKTPSALYNSSPATRWKDWILEESARRLCVIYQVVNMLVYFEPAAMCEVHQTGLLLAPLPAKRQLWEAADELSWTTESQRAPAELQKAFGLAANGDLVRVDEGRLYCGDAAMLQSKFSDERTPARSTAKWEEWCSGMDGLGGLVMLAASLVA